MEASGTGLPPALTCMSTSTKSPVCAARSTVDERRGLLAQALELGVDLFGRHLDILLHALELELLRQRARGLQRELGGERERLALARDRLEVDARPVGGAQARFRDRLTHPRGQELAHRLLEDLLAAHALQHHRGRHLALAEAGDLRAVHEVPERVAQVVVDPVGLELDLEPRAAAFQHRGRRPHWLRTLDDSAASDRRQPGPPLPWARAGVAELVDAPDLGSGERELVEVRVLSPAWRAISGRPRHGRRRPSWPPSSGSSRAPRSVPRVVVTTSRMASGGWIPRSSSCRPLSRSCRAHTGGPPREPDART